MQVTSKDFCNNISYLSSYFLIENVKIQLALLKLKIWNYNISEGSRDYMKKMKRKVDAQCTRVHGWKWGHYRLIYFVNQSLHILLKKNEKCNNYNVHKYIGSKQDVNVQKTSINNSCKTQRIEVYVVLIS